MQNRPEAPLCRLYLRASNKEADAARARPALERFAVEHGLRIVGSYVEHESGTRLDRPELWRLLSDSHPGDVLLTEQVDRLSRLTDADWRRLRTEIEARQVRVVALDLPTSWTMTVPADEFTGRMFTALNNLLLDMLAAISRKDWSDRRRRQMEGQQKAKIEGRYKGRVEDVKRNSRIERLLDNGLSWTAVMETVGCSRATVARVAARRRIAGEEKS